MSASDLFGIIGVIVGIASLIFAMWTWMRSESKRHDLLKSLGDIYEIAENALLEASLSASGRVGETHGALESIHTLSAKYSDRPTVSDLLSLVKQRVIWDEREIWNLEVSPAISEIWLITPDLKPDSSEEETGKIVHENIMKGKTYVYFYPDDLPRKESEIARLKENISLANPAHAETLLSRITLVALNRTEHATLFYRGNIILFFRDKNRIFPPRCFEEVVLTKISRRGIFWQEHSESIANEIKHELDAELSRGEKALDR